MTHELYKRYRPTKFEDVVGQDVAVRTLKSFVAKGKVPHAIMITGPSGTGKTTMARILADAVGAAGKMDITEVDTPSLKEPLASIRDIKCHSRASPRGKARVWILDEVQSLSRANMAQQALLEMLEEAPPTAYFFLCTTDPAKVIDTVRSRCTEVRTVPLKRETVIAVVSRVLKAEGAKVAAKVMDGIVDGANGSARRALVLLEKTLEFTTPEDQLAALQNVDAQAKSIDLCRALIDRRSRWADVAKMLKDVEGEDAEGVRRHVLAYARAVLLGRDHGRAYAVIQAFRDDVFHSGHAGLAANAYYVLGEK